MRINKSNHILLGVVVVATLVVGYAVFAAPLSGDNITGSANNWNIGFIDAKKVAVNGQATETSEVVYNANSATFNISFAGPGDSITYDFAIKNNGLLDAKVDSIHILPSNKIDDVALFEVKGLEVGDELDAGEVTHMQVIATYNSNYQDVAKNVSKGVTVVVNYKENS